MARGIVYEELAELAPHTAADFAAKALIDLEVNSWFRELEPARWAKLQRLATGRKHETGEQTAEPELPMTGF